MKKLVLFILIGLCNQISGELCHSKASNDSINDGPYIFYINDTLKAKQIENNLLTAYNIFPENYSQLKTTLHLSCDYQDLMNVFSKKTDYNQNFSGVDSLAALSDIHGQYKIYINLLIANGIIDQNLNWNFGKGHLVIAGDIFDRGNMVTEILWHLFNLEKQAEKAGGMVHVLLGNHENMVLSEDLRYLNEKYKKVEELAKTKYSDLYAVNSVLGKWLRNQPVILSINDILFTHAGISTNLVRNQLTVEQINETFSKEIIGKQLENKNEKLQLLSENDGPLWYRGYFADSTFCESKVDSILDFYNKKHIVVGHSTNKQMKIILNNKIIGIDTGINYEQPGVVLIYKDGKFYEGSSTGMRVKLFPE